MQTLSAHLPLGQARLALSGLALFAALLLGGCGFGGSPAQPETPPGPVTGFMIASNVGETATVDDPDFGKGVRVSLDELFTSAKGEDCKRGTVLAGQREAEVIVICRDTTGRWTMAPRGGSTNRQVPLGSVFSPAMPPCEGAVGLTHRQSMLAALQGLQP